MEHNENLNWKKYSETKILLLHYSTGGGIMSTVTGKEPENGRFCCTVFL